MSKDRPLISFDWAAKRMLRNKANYEVVEGFLSELLGRDVRIIGILESEGNQEQFDDKFDRVDVVVEDESKEIFLIEIQFSTQTDYFQRMLYGVSKAITDRIRAGEKYGSIKKIYSINIVYFDLGQGDDYVYHGKTLFKGLHMQDTLKLANDQRFIFGKNEPGDLYPEYYVLKINDFDDLAKNTLDEWIYFLKNNRIENGFTAKGLLKAREILDYDRLSPEEKAEHDRIIELRAHYRYRIEDAVMRGKLEAKMEYDKALEEKNNALKEKNNALEEQRRENAKLREQLAEMKRDRQAE
jgi:predicted transposase/invertase (TIGR01784 family)